ncbi:YdcF family protein [Hwanghaeella sp. LZ110]|uniref:YdcF family protein n=1 Tax=Hwanghaeella sp. LZ110 TaxID=3402810 RepID=UPI003B67B84F
MARRRDSRKRRYPIGLLLVAVLATGWALGFVVFASTIPETPAPLSEKTDAIVVLTGGTLRLEAGIELLEAKAADRLFVSGVHRGVDVAELLRIQKRAPDRLQCCIILGHDAVDTDGNAQETAAWVKEAGIHSIRLVTAGYHMPRSLLEFRAVMPGIKIVPHPVSPDHVKHERWYRYPGTAALIAGEYTKFILVWIRQTLRELVLGPEERL